MDEIPSLIQCNSFSGEEWSPRKSKRKDRLHVTCHGTGRVTDFASNEFRNSELPPPPPSSYDEDSLFDFSSPRSSRTSPGSSKSRSRKSIKKRLVTVLSPKSGTKTSSESKKEGCGDDKYKPQKSQISGISRIERPPDGDTWREVVVKHRTTGRIRSFFISDKTGEKRWDEPPSGASNIVLATLHHRTELALSIYSHHSER